MIVTVEELKDFMSNITLDADQESAAELVIAGVQGFVETYLNRPIEQDERTETVVVDPEGYARLSATPVISVSSVRDNAGDETNIDYVVEQSRLLVGYGFAPVSGQPMVTVTYVGGLDGPNIPELKLIVLRVASRQMHNMHDDTLTNADLTTSAPSNSPLPDHLSEEEMKLISRHRRRMVFNQPRNDMHHRPYL